MKVFYLRNIFINCPFDESYLSIFHALLFTLFECGYIPRSALEIDDSSEVRIDKIMRIISQCKYGIHDISRTEPDEKTKLPRFNMPLELGIFLGAKRFGKNKQKKKTCLVLDRTPYRYQRFISDIAGQDIQSHYNDYSEVIKVVRNWIRNTSGRETIPGGSEILRRYRLFQSELPGLCRKLRLNTDELIFNDYSNIVYRWLKENPA
jgi:hypothetical protein